MKSFSAASAIRICIQRGTNGDTIYPCLPGHEIIGRVVKAGSKVSKLRKGDIFCRNENEMLKNENSFDFILDTVSADHDINAYLRLLKRDGTLALVGAPAA